MRLPIQGANIMAVHLIGPLLGCGLLMFVTATTGFAVEKKARTTSQDPVASTTTVKSSKSNTSDRMGGGGGKAGIRLATFEIGRAHV